MNEENYARLTTPCRPRASAIGKKSAHIIGGGSGGLSAAAFLVDDAYMPANRITVYDSLGVVDAP